MRTANLLRLQVERIPVSGDPGEVREFFGYDATPLTPCEGDEVEMTEKVEHRHIMDVRRVTGFGARRQNYIVMSPEVEELLGIPCDLMHKQADEIHALSAETRRLRQRVREFENMTLWQKLKSLLLHEVCILKLRFQWGGLPFWKPVSVKITRSAS